MLKRSNARFNATAPHAFTVFGSERYQARADEKSWAAFLGLLDEVP